jgi:AcrR family transcriptional regulator
MDTVVGAEPDAGSRQDRRKAKTRRALIDAAQGFMEAGNSDPSIQEITEAADVGFGSFYNHFTTKAELFDAALADVAESYGQFLDSTTEHLTDPAEVFALSVRMTGRMLTTRPQAARIISRTGLSFLSSEIGLAPRALRDLQLGMDAGRFSVQNPLVALASAGGALLGLLHISRAHPELVDEAAFDELAEHLLRMYGLPAAEAHELAHRELPASTVADGA